MLSVMVEFACDDKRIEEVMRKIVDLVRDHGGFVHEKLTIGCQDGFFRVTAPPDVPQGEKILALPRPTLLPITKFKLELDDDYHFVIKSYDKDLKEGQIQLLEAMVELFNLTEKIKSHRDVVTLSLYHDDRALFERVFAARTRDSLPHIGKLPTETEKEFLLSSFVKTRVLGFKNPPVTIEEQLAAEEKGEEIPTHTQVIMPIVEFIDNHPDAVGFLNNTMKHADFPNADFKLPPIEERDAVTVVRWSRKDDPETCYVSYGPYDAFDTTIHYNYIEPDASFLHSVPLDIALPGLGTIKILTMIGILKHKKLPEHLSDLGFYLPRIVFMEKEKIVSLGFLKIPERLGPRSMRRVLAVAISHLAKGIKEEDLMYYLGLAEKKVIEVNMAFYKDLQKEIKKASHKKKVRPLVYDNLLRMTEVQIEKLQKYPFFEEVMAEPVKKAGKKG